MKHLVLYITTGLASILLNAQSNPVSVKIGDQIFMVKNLDVDHYRNGDPIPEVKDSAEWANLKTGAWCYYDNDPANGKIYGRMYNGYAINDPRGLAPTGWHIPSYEEWKNLTDYLGGLHLAAKRIQEIDPVHWLIPNTDTSSNCGFNALPGGQRIRGSFKYLGYFAIWWSAKKEGADYGYKWNDNSSTFVVGIGSLEHGCSVRCIKD